MSNFDSYLAKSNLLLVKALIYTSAMRGADRHYEHCVVGILPRAEDRDERNQDDLRKALEELSSNGRRYYALMNQTVREAEALLAEMDKACDQNLQLARGLREAGPGA